MTMITPNALQGIFWHHAIYTSPQNIDFKKIAGFPARFLKPHSYNRESGNFTEMAVGCVPDNTIMKSHAFGLDPNLKFRKNFQGENKMHKNNRSSPEKKSRFNCFGNYRLTRNWLTFDSMPNAVDGVGTDCYQFVLLV